MGLLKKRETYREVDERFLRNFNKVLERAQKVADELLHEIERAGVVLGNLEETQNDS